MTVPSISAEIPDWSREAVGAWRWQPGRQLIRSVRDHGRLAGRRGPLARLARAMCVLRHRFWSAVTSADIPLGSTIGGGLLLPHPAGIVVHPDARIGPNCLIMQGVTIGQNRGPGVPTIGGHVDIGPGAVILGAVTVGDHATVGANAVVLHDVPAHAVVVGAPARPTNKRLTDDATAATAVDGMAE